MDTENIGKGIAEIAKIVQEVAIVGIPKVLKSSYDSGEASSMTIKIAIDDTGEMKISSSYALKDEPQILEIEILNKGADVNIVNYVDVHQTQHGNNEEQLTYLTQPE